MVQKTFQRVLALVFGATTGMSIAEFTKDGAQIIHQEDIPWIQPIEGLILWPMDWLEKRMGWIRKNLFRAGVIFTSSMWGSDMFLKLRLGEDTCSLPHYRSACDHDLDRMLTRIGMTRKEMYLLSGGAAAAFYQPLGLLGATERFTPELLRDWPVLGALPFSGVITFLLSGQHGQDPIMRQSMGLHVPSSAKLYEGTNFGMIKGDLVGKGVVHPENAVLRLPVKDGEATIIPCSHDSVFSRLVGLAECDTVFWTGSWLGTTILIDDLIQPTEETFEASINFEGLGPYRAAVTNTGMFGPVYEKLIEALGFTGKTKYRDAAQAGSKFPSKCPDIGGCIFCDESAIDSIVRGYYQEPGMAVAGYVKGIAYTMVEELQKVKATLGIQFDGKIAITGGWAENKVFTQALQSFGLKVITPRHAANATHAGLAADALVRCGKADTVKEALDMLPEIK